MLDRAVHGDGYPGRRTGSRRSVLLSTWPSVAAQFHVQVQGDRGRGPTTTVVTGMSQCVSTWRSSTTVRFTVVCLLV